MNNVGIIEYLCSEYSARAHNGQCRKDKKTPYIVHPARVASSLHSYPCYIVVSAWLHDVIEDCSVLKDGKYIIRNQSPSHQDMEKFLKEIDPKNGSKIFEIVKMLSFQEDKNSKESKLQQRLKYYQKIKEHHLASDLFIVKCADRHDNLLGATKWFTRDGLKYYLKDSYNLYSVAKKIIKKDAFKATFIIRYNAVLDFYEKQYKEKVSEKIKWQN